MHERSECGGALATAPVYHPHEHRWAEILRTSDILGGLRLFAAACAVRWMLCAALAVGLFWR
jgi:hypothetical protein